MSMIILQILLLLVGQGQVKEKEANNHEQKEACVSNLHSLFINECEKNIFTKNQLFDLLRLSWFQSDSSTDVESLIGVSDLKVYIYDVTEDANRKINLSTQQLKIDAELLLRTSGIKLKDDSKHTLMIEVNALFDGDEDVPLRPSVYFQVSFYQQTLLIAPPIQKNGEFKLRRRLLRTWGHYRVIGHSKGKIADDVRQSVKDIVARFANDYLKANPK